MGELVGDHVEALGEALEELPVAIPVDHLAAVPERVVVADPVVNRGHEGHAAIVDGVAAVGIVVEVPGGARAVVGLVDRHVLDGPLALAAHERSGELRAVPGVVHRALLASRGQGRHGGDVAEELAPAADSLGDRQGPATPTPAARGYPRSTIARSMWGGKMQAME